MNHCAIARANEHNPTWSLKHRAQCLLRHVARETAKQVAKLRSLDQRRTMLAELDADMRAAVQAELQMLWARHG